MRILYYFMLIILTISFFVNTNNIKEIPTQSDNNRFSFNDGGISLENLDSHNRLMVMEWESGRLVSNKTNARCPTTAIDSEGTIYIAHISFDDLFYYIYLYSSSDNGITWDLFPSRVKTKNQMRSIEIGVDIGTNMVYIVFDNFSDDWDIYLWRVNHLEDKIIPINSASGNQCYPQITIDYIYGYNNHIFVAYQNHLSETDQDLYVMRSIDHGITFEEWKNVGKTSFPHIDFNDYAQPDLTVDGQGYVYLTYSNMEEESSAIWVEYGLRNSSSSQDKFEYREKVYDGSIYTSSHPSIAVTRNSGTVTIMITFQSYGIDAVSNNWEIVVAHSIGRNNGDKWPYYLLTNSLGSEMYPRVTVSGMDSINSVNDKFYLVYGDRGLYNTIDRGRIFSADVHKPNTWVELGWINIYEKIQVNDIYTFSMTTFQSNQDEWSPIAVSGSEIMKEIFISGYIGTGPLPAPIQKVPIDNREFGAYDPPFFRWEDVSDADCYNIEFVNLTQEETQKENIFENISIKPIRPRVFKFYTRNLIYIPDLPDYGGQYKWRIRANDSDGLWGTWSPYEYFHRDIYEYRIPILITPKNKTIIRDTLIHFEWVNETEKSFDFEIFQYDEKIGNKVVYEELDITQNKIHRIFPLKDGKYYWHVRCIDINYNKGDWSESRQFYLNTTSIERITLISPSTGSVIEYPTPHLDWEPLGLAISYQIQISDAENFNNILQDVNTSNNDFIASYLTNGKYYWRVRARNAVGIMGNWSVVWIIEINSELTAIPEPTVGFDGLILIMCLNLIVIHRSKKK